MTSTTDYEKLIEALVNQISKMIGDVAITSANSVEGLTVNNKKVKLTGDPAKVITELSEKYESLIGPTFRTLAIRAIQPLLDQYPELKGKIPSWFYNTLQEEIDKYLNE